ncbi:hypothetical protein ACFTUC_17090 [Streptomyces sp. NPDC056944]|uniref:hypothetical protein n=1 Tax=Streptomyces sp. NPDC056944 TaxID=3345972 RepID=UPI00363F40FC
MARMMAKFRWTQKPGWYCCPGHDPDLYAKGSQRAKEKRGWRKLDIEYIEDCEWCQDGEAFGLFEVDGIETGLCAECAQDNTVERDCE